MITYYLGSHIAPWVERTTTPLMISIDRILNYRVTPFENCICNDVFLDSNAFNKLKQTGKWDRTTKEHTLMVRKCMEIIPSIKHVSPMDYMCEPYIVSKTGLSETKHIELTVNNFTDLMSIDDSIPWIPVIQGFTLSQYDYCINLFHKNGVDLSYAGVGSVCRRQNTDEIEAVINFIHSCGVGIHAFGVKQLGLERYRDKILSADSMAWSVAARYSTPLPECTHRNCANCLKYAEKWYDNVIQR